MPARIRPTQFCAAFVLIVAFFALYLSTPALLLHAAPPKINYIERVTNGALNGVLLHCEIEPFRTYALQYTTNLGKAGVPAGPWSNLYVTLPSPENHLIFYDTITDSQSRFYRLQQLP